MPSDEACEVIQQLQQRVMDLELQTIPQTLQEVCDQRELNAQSTVERIKTLAAECKQLSSRSAQIYEQLSEDPELKKLESQLQEAKQARRYSTGVAQAPVTHREDEEIPGTTHRPTTHSYHIEQSDGSHPETPAEPGGGLSTV
jgi:hypothetical protein